MRIMYKFILAMALLLTVSQVHAAGVDARFKVHLQQEDENVASLSIKDAMALALPILWQRVVPTADVEKAKTLTGRKSLMLQFNSVAHGVDLVFNPVQIQSLLRRKGITMIPERPHWKLSILVLGFSGADEATSLDLMNYSYGMADELGFELSSQGKKLQLIFTPSLDAYGEPFVHVDMQGSFSADILSQTEQPAQGYVSYQLQAWTDEILHEIRDAYSLGTLDFNELSSEMLLTIDSEFSLATQVMLEQALSRESAVVTVVPVLLQKAHRQYSVTLRDQDDSWVESWFAGYGLTAVKQMEESETHWLVQ
jgi:hypothetical protein